MNTYTIDEVKGIDAHLVAGCSPVHIQSVIEKLQRTAIAAMTAPPSESDKEDAELTDAEILDAVYRHRRPFIQPAAKQETIEHARRILRAARAKKDTQK